MQFPHPPSTPFLLIYLLKHLLHLCRQQITKHNQQIPIYSFIQQLNPITLSYDLIPNQLFQLTTGSLAKFIRLLELIKICIGNLEQNKTITKRNLFYKLEHYYQKYATVDKDLKLICQNLYFLSLKTNHQNALINRVVRHDLGVVASSRCILFGSIQIQTDGKFLNIIQSQITTLPTCGRISVKCQPKCIVVIQKQSMFFQIISTFKHHKIHSNYLLLTAKGYPDQITRNLLLQLMHQKQPQITNIFYLGDFDVFGFDIFLFYVFGDWFCEGLLPKINIIQLGRTKNNKIFNWYQLQHQLNIFTKHDDNKVLQIRQKWFKKLQNKRQQFSQQILIKIQNIISYFNQFVNSRYKCQLELFSQHAFNSLWLHELIQLLILY